MKIHTPLALAGALLLAAGAANAQTALPEHFAKMDKDGDGKLSPAEWTRDKPQTFKKMDANGDKFADKAEVEKFYVAIAPLDDPKTAKRISGVLNADTNGDGKVTIEELTEYSLVDFKKRDKDGDGFISGDDAAKK
ncbi:hypothetical protein PQU92_09465 [Asticcacaulis sp. BYS171W]|uniref:EF-hand domain-containing protein n=1 Tax=Asticcacaulis aquaticus TaxID=2984212 RepID=A0ABT5HTV6_9CAUL|nr:hypothetical protein [Asticcacaulis aquaticus]MDC7683503.1 hypothetical protein [Asticcacaulis aquaticus]